MIGESLIELYDLLQVHDSIGMEKVELALPENLAQILEKVRKDLLHARSMVLLSINQLIDVFCGAESIGPYLKLKRKLELVISELKDLLQGIFFI